MWLTSPKVLPIIVLVVIPFSVTILALVLSTFAPFGVSKVIKGFSYAFSYIYLISFVSLAYAFYPIKFRSIERRGFSRLSIEKEYIKKILLFEIPILIFVAVVIALFHLDYIQTKTFGLMGEPFELRDYAIIVINPYSGNRLDVGGDVFLFYIVNGLMVNLGFSVTAGIIWMILVTARKELGYYFAKSLFQTATQEKKASKKAEYLIKATKLYDKYLRRTLNLEINDSKKIYSKILSDPNLNRNESIQTISESFEGNDDLEPIKSLSKILDVKDTDIFLVDESIGKKIKDMAIFFATIIPVVVTIIQLMLPKAPPGD